MITIKAKKHTCKQVAKIRNIYMNKRNGTRTKSEQAKHNKTRKVWDSACLKRTNLQNTNILKKEEKSWKLMNKLFPKQK